MAQSEKLAYCVGTGIRGYSMTLHPRCKDCARRQEFDRQMKNHTLTCATSWIPPERYAEKCTWFIRGAERFPWLKRRKTDTNKVTQDTNKVMQTQTN